MEFKAGEGSKTFTKLSGKRIFREYYTLCSWQAESGILCIKKASRSKYEQTFSRKKKGRLCTKLTLCTGFKEGLDHKGLLYAVLSWISTRD